MTGEAIGMQDQQLEPLVRVIVEEVQRALQPASSAAPLTVAGGNVFCLFYEAPTALEVVGRQMVLLQDRGVTFGCLQPGIVLPEVFRQIEWNDCLKELGTEGLGQVLKNYEFYLIANLSRRALAELATGVTASIQSELVYQAMGQKSRVAAVQDPLAVDRVDCPQDPIKLAPVQSEIADQLDRLRDLGVDLVLSETLYDHLSHQVEHESQTVDALRGFVTLEDVEGFEGREIRLVRGTKLTPLAQDWLRDHRIEIRFVDP